MHVGIVGGLDRAAPLFHRIAGAAGHTLELHTGRTNARGAASLETLVERADLLVVVTDLNSHGGVQLARRLAERRGRPVILLRKLGSARLAALLAELAQGAQATAPS